MQLGGVIKWQGGSSLFRQRKRLAAKEAQLNEPQERQRKWLLTNALFSHFSQKVQQEVTFRNSDFNVL